eukprot:6383681-Prymnesium_polylepis.1
MKPPQTSRAGLDRLSVKHKWPVSNAAAKASPANFARITLHDRRPSLCRSKLVRRTAALQPTSHPCARAYGFSLPLSFMPLHLRNGRRPRRSFLWRRTTLSRRVLGKN